MVVVPTGAARGDGPTTPDVRPVNASQLSAATLIVEVPERTIKLAQRRKSMRPLLHEQSNVSNRNA